MERRYQVFVSSTYTDLIDERREVIQALLEMECLPAGMELFPATNQSQWELIAQTIDDSDYYVVVVGGRYGSLGPEGVSYTEQEFDYAVSTGMPILGFVHSDPDNLPRPKTEVDPDGYAKLSAFREKVKQNPIRFYTSPEDLGGKVSRSLTIARTKNPREGWVRGRFAMTPEVQTQLAELRAEIAEQQSIRSQKATAVPDDLANGEDVYEIQVTIDYYTKEEAQKRTYERRKSSVDLGVSVSWSEILSGIGHGLMDEASEPALHKTLSSFAFDAWAEDPPARIAKDWGQYSDCRIHNQSVTDILIQLFALGYIQRGTRKRPIADQKKYWALTTSGQDALLKLRAIRKGD